jgi:DNA-binding response OmpR family regulator
MKNILLVDDDAYVLDLVSIHLKKEGYEVTTATDGTEALELLEEQVPHLAVVDVMMPKMDGYTLTEKIRESYDIPIILLTAKDQIEDKERGFEAGTDDYLVKPFEPKELSFRIKALLRRYPEQAAGSVVQIGDTFINKDNYEVQNGNRTILLPLKEFELLFYLMSNPDQAFSRNHLIEQVWGPDYEGDERTVDVHVKRLRERNFVFADDFEIKTVRGVGYALERKDS